MSGAPPGVPEVPGSTLRGAIFDVGNVLLRLRPLYLDPAARMRAHPALDRFERGLAGEAEFFQAARERLGIAHSDAELRGAYLDILGDPIPGMAELIGELRRRGVRVVGLSDISPGHLALIAGYPAVQALERVVASCETGHRKPEPGAYRAALAALETEPGETLFVDDRPENVAGAAALGLRAVLFEGPEALRARLGL